MNNIDLVLAIDPGETCGFALFGLSKGRPPHISRTWQIQGLPLPAFVRAFRQWLRTTQPDIVVVENYTVFAGAAKLHIGLPLATSEIIGAIIALCTVSKLPDRPVARVDSAKKQRWPDARIRAKLPELSTVVCTTHEADAIKIGLVYIEREGLWSP